MPPPKKRLLRETTRGPSANAVGKPKRFDCNGEKLESKAACENFPAAPARKFQRILQVARKRFSGICGRGRSRSRCRNDCAWLRALWPRGRLARRLCPD